MKALKLHLQTESMNASSDGIVFNFKVLGHQTFDKKQLIDFMYIVLQKEMIDQSIQYFFCVSTYSVFHITDPT